ncbi:MAG: hypothetical protein KJO76_07880, partial [Gammaproteobacteria bacterium]|nr:hypothetical protein [Gammaproteobacteria bacterium]
MTIDRPLASGACAVLSTLLCGTLNAEPAVYADQQAFAAALPSAPHVLDFDHMAPGTTIEDTATAGGITFSYDFEGLSMRVAHLYATTSSPNFLGTADGGKFHDGHNITQKFAPGSAILLYFISADTLEDRDIKD